MRIRERERQTGGESRQGIVYVTPWLQPQFGIPVQHPSIPRRKEYMYDTVGAQQCDFNPCYHDKFLKALDSDLEYFAVARNADGSEYDSYSYSGIGITPQGLREALRTIYSYEAKDLADASAEAEDHFRTTVDDSHSIINFIIELIEMCEGNIETLENLRRLLDRIIDAFRRYYQQTGNLWLAWNFCIKPSISDIIDMLNVLKAAEKKLKWLKHNNRRPCKVRFKSHPKTATLAVYCPVEAMETVNPPPPDPPLYPPNFVPSAPNLRFRLDCEVKQSLNQWAIIYFDIPDAYLDDWVSAIGMISMTMSGIYNPLKIIWEAIPFSWLIEWFTNKKTQLLKELASLSLYPDAQILGNGWSIKSEIDATMTLETGDPAGWEWPAGNFQYLRFERGAGYPDQATLGFSTDITVRQQSLWFAIASNKTIIKGGRHRGFRSL